MKKVSGKKQIGKGGRPSIVAEWVSQLFRANETAPPSYLILEKGIDFNGNPEHTRQTIWRYFRQKEIDGIEVIRDGQNIILQLRG